MSIRTHLRAIAGRFARGCLFLVALTGYGEEQDATGYYVSVAASEFCGSDYRRGGGSWRFGVGWSAEDGNDAARMAVEECSRLGDFACSACDIPSTRGGCVALVRGDWTRTPRDAGADTEIRSGLFAAGSAWGRSVTEAEALGKCETGMLAGTHSDDEVEGECVPEIVFCSEDVTTRDAPTASTADSNPPAAAKPATEPVDAVAAVRRAGDVFRDRLGSGRQGPEMVVIPAGQFRMGCLSADADCDGDDKPVRQVTIARPFALSVHEVTFEDYDRFTYPDKVDDEGWGRSRRPVINVSWDDAQDYVEWLSAQTGAAYRLPSEAEWEYAARAGTTTKYSWGNETGVNRANCRGCGSQWDAEQTAPAGSFAPNAFGLFDMHGNVWEWVADCWNGSYAGAPVDGTAWVSGNCDLRVSRGGPWGLGPWSLGAAARGGDSTGVRSNNGGFRVARTLKSRACARLEYPNDQCAQGSTATVRNELTDRSVRVTVERRWDTGRSERSYDLPAGGSEFVGCTADQWWPPTTFRFRILGCERKASSRQCGDTGA